AKAGRYRAVVVPPSTNWEAATVRLLERFVTAGGGLVIFGERPTLVDGRPAAARWRRLAARAVRLAGPAGLAAAAGPSRDFAAVVNGRRRDGDLAYQHRVEGGRHLFFVINRSRT